MHRDADTAGTIRGRRRRRAVAHLVVTRFQLASARATLPFLRASMKAANQARRSAGFVAGTVLKDRGRAYWTCTLWDTADAARSYRDAAFHGAVMPAARRWATTMATAAVDTPRREVPDWHEAAAVLATGRVVRMPAGRDATLQEATAPPRRTRPTIAVRPKA